MLRGILVAACLCGCASGLRPHAQGAARSVPGSDPAGHAAEDTATARRDSAALEDFLAELERSVRKHDKPALVALLDPEYKAKQLVRIYQGNPDPFLNTLICGQVVDSDQHYCLEFDAIFH